MKTTIRPRTIRPRAEFAAAAGSLAVAAALLAVPAQADPPDNDDITGAAPTTVGQSTVDFDTTEATADPTDGRCVTGNSIWYKLRAPSTRGFRLTTAGSSFDTRLAVFKGPRGNRSLVECDDNGGPGRTSAAAMRIREGKRYWIAISGGDAGGLGRLTTKEHELEPGVDLDITSVEAGAISGRLFVEGTMECQTPSEVGVFVRVSQAVGDSVARGAAFRSKLCDDNPDNDPETWRVVIDSETGTAFQAGQVSVRRTTDLWDGFSALHDAETTQEVATSVAERRAP